MIIPIVDKVEFWKRVQFSSEGCWLWTGATVNGNYGVVTYQGRQYRTHIIAFYLTIGVWPGDRNILHTCDNPRCCRPDHLIDGTHQDNMADCASKNRQPGGIGGSHHTWLTQADADEIRRLRLFDISVKEISQMPRFKGKIGIYGIYKILQGKVWNG
jgi:hypothetical protein